MWFSVRWLVVGVFLSFVNTVTPTDFLKEFVKKFRNNNTSPCDDFYRHICPTQIAKEDTMRAKSEELMWDWMDAGWGYVAVKQILFEAGGYKIRNFPNIKVIGLLPTRAVVVYSLNQRAEKHPLHGYDFGELEKMYEELYEMLKEEINYPGNPEYGDFAKYLWNITFPEVEHIFGLSNETMQDAELYLDVYFKIQRLYYNFLSILDRAEFSNDDVNSRLDELFVLYDTLLLPVLEKIPQLKRFAVESSLTIEAFNWRNRIFISESLLAPILQQGVPESVLLGYGGIFTAHELYHSFIRKSLHMELSDKMKEKGKCHAEHYKKSCRIWREGDCHSGRFTMNEDASDMEGFQLALKLLKKRLGKKIKEPVYPDLPITHEQMFFYSSTISFCDTYRSSQHKYEDVHSADRLRNNAVFSMMKTFQEAFQCQEGDKMVQRSQCNYFGSDVRR